MKKVKGIKSQKGFSLIEIGVAIIVVTLFMGLNISLYNGAYNNYRIVLQRNRALAYAIEEIELNLNSQYVDVVAKVEPATKDNGNLSKNVTINEVVGANRKVKTITVTVGYKIKPKDVEEKKLVLQTVIVD